MQKNIFDQAYQQTLRQLKQEVDNFYTNLALKSMNSTDVTSIAMAVGYFNDSIRSKMSQIQQSFENQINSDSTLSFSEKNMRSGKVKSDFNTLNNQITSKSQTTLNISTSNFQASMYNKMLGF